MALRAVKIPCKKYIAKYLYVKLGARHGNPLIIKRNSNIYAFLKMLLRKNYKRNEKRWDPEKYDETLLVLINTNAMRYGYRLSNTTVSHFNTYMRNRIFEEFREKVAENNGNGESKEYLAIEFLNRYKITEDELSVDTLLRDERRNKVSIN